MAVCDNHRTQLREAHRIVVKVGTRVLVQRSGKPDLGRIESLVSDLAELHQQRRQMVLVSSGAVGAGMGALGFRKRPDDISDLQMAAAIGQVRLMTRYQELFSKCDRTVGQVLLTHADLKDRARHLNAQNTMLHLLKNEIVPIVNENDVVAVDEITFGDNDLLAALVAVLVEADLLILLTVVDGIREPLPSGRTRRIPYLRRLTSEVHELAMGTHNPLSVGGMVTKLQAAENAVYAGCHVVIADGRKPNILERILQGDDVGTFIHAQSRRSSKRIRGRKKWIAFFHRSQGTLIIDEGARLAVEEKGKSLLPIGIRKIEGKFNMGDLVQVRSTNNALVARGLVEYSSQDLEKIKGHKTSAIAHILGAKAFDEVIHRDNMVILTDNKGERA